MKNILILISFFSIYNMGIAQNKEIKKKLEKQYQTVTYVSECEQYIVKNGEGNYGLCDKNGIIIVEPQFNDNLRYWGDKLYQSQIICTDCAERILNGCLSASGKEIITPSFRRIWYFEKIHRLVVFRAEFRQVEGKYGLYDTLGNDLTGVIYDFIGGFGEGLAMVKRDSKWGYIETESGTVVIPIEYDDATPFSEGAAMVKQNGESFLIPNPLLTVETNDQPKIKGKVVSSFPAADSEVDKTIPKGKKADANTHAFIIANENYPVAKVPYALNDGWTFEKYCKQTLGIKDENVHLFEDATGGNIVACVEQMKQTARDANGEATIFFYYAGHAFPDEDSKSGYLLPIDGDSKNIATGYSLERLYKELNSISAKQIVCFIDACFSGTTREDNMLIAGRGVAIKVNDEVPQGNMVVFTSATGAETAHSYEERHHGLFTYYLLEKLQQTKGNVTLGELSEYVTKMVKRKSVLINQKKQTPTVIPSPQQQTTWQNIRL